MEEKILDLGFVNNDDDIKLDGTFYDDKGTIRNAFEEVEKVEKELEERQTSTIHFRCAPGFADKAKKIAVKKGLKYTTYIKSALKQQMDKDEKELFST